MKGTTLAFVVLAVLAPQLAAAQSTPLAVVAQKEEARRAAVKQPSKAYTNADLKRDPRDEPALAPATPELPSGFVSKATGKDATPEETLANSKAGLDTEGAKAEEASWRSRAEMIRGEVAKAQSVVNTLAGAANPNTPAQKDALAQARATLGLAQERWDSFATQAGVAKVPKTWLEQKPKLSER